MSAESSELGAHVRAESSELGTPSTESLPPSRSEYRREQIQLSECGGCEQIRSWREMRNRAIRRMVRIRVQICRNRRIGWFGGIEENKGDLGMSVI